MPFNTSPSELYCSRAESSSSGRGGCGGDCVVRHRRRGLSRGGDSNERTVNKGSGKLSLFVIGAAALSLSDGAQVMSVYKKQEETTMPTRSPCSSYSKKPCVCIRTSSTASQSPSCSSHVWQLVYDKSHTQPASSAMAKR